MTLIPTMNILKKSKCLLELPSKNSASQTKELAMTSIMTVTDNQSLGMNYSVELILTEIIAISHTSLPSVH